MPLFANQFSKNEGAPGDGSNAGNTDCETVAEVKQREAQLEEDAVEMAKEMSEVMEQDKGRAAVDRAAHDQAAVELAQEEFLSSGKLSKRAAAEDVQDLYHRTTEPVADPEPKQGEKRERLSSVDCSPIPRAVARRQYSPTDTPRMDDEPDVVG